MSWCVCVCMNIYYLLRPFSLFRERSTRSKATMVSPKNKTKIRQHTHTHNHFLNDIHKSQLETTVSFFFTSDLRNLTTRKKMEKFTSDVKDFLSKQMGRVRERVRLGSSSEFQRQIEEFYRIHNPSKLPHVETLARDFATRRDDLMRALHNKYAPCDDVRFVHKNVNYKELMMDVLKKISRYARDDSFSNVDVETCLRRWNGNESRLLDGLTKKISEFESAAMAAALTHSTTTTTDATSNEERKDKDMAALVKQGTNLIDEETRASIFKICKRWLAFGVENLSQRDRKVQDVLKGSRRFVEKMEAAKMRMAFQGNEIARKTKILNRSSQKYHAYVEDRVAKWNELVKEMESCGSIREDLRSVRESIGSIRDSIIQLQNKVSKLEEQRLDRDLKVQVQALKQNQTLTLRNHRERCKEELRELQVACDRAASIESDRKYREKIEAFRSENASNNTAVESSNNNKKSESFVSTVQVTSVDGSRHSVDVRLSQNDDPDQVAIAFAAKYNVARKDYEALLKFLREKIGGY